METALPLLLFLGLLFAGVIVILGTACWSRVLEEREEHATPADGLNAWARPFLSVPSLNGFESAADQVDDSLVDGVQNFLRIEHTLANDFVAAPSAESLHGRSVWESRFGDSLRNRVESWLRGELDLVDEFVSDPSVERLLPTGLNGGVR